MAFPVNGIIDNFNRANGSLGANWTTDPYNYGATGHNISSNQAVGSASGSNDSRYTASSFSGDLEAYVTLVTKPTNGKELSLLVRAQGSLSDGSDNNFYQLSLSPNAGTDDIVIQKAVAGSFSTLATYNEEIVNGYKYGISISGTTITAWRNNGGGWVALGSVTDSSVTGTGYLQIYSSDTTATFDDFGGGAFKTVNASALPITSNLPTSTRKNTKLPSVLTGSFILTNPTFSTSANLTKIVSALTAVASLQTSLEKVLISPNNLSGTYSLETSNRIAKVLPQDQRASFAVNSPKPLVTFNSSIQSITALLNPVILAGVVNATVTVSPLSISSSLKTSLFLININVSILSYASSVVSSIPKGTIFPNSLALAMQSLSPSVLTVFSTTVVVSALSGLFNLYPSYISIPVRRSVIFTHNNQTKVISKSNIRFDNQRTNATINKTKSLQVKQTTKAEF